MLRPGRVIASVLLCVGAASPGLSATGLDAAFGFPGSTLGTLDVRVWVGGGVVVPETVYRIYEDASGNAHGQVIRWLRLDSSATGAARSSNRRSKRLMRKICRSPRTDGDLTWCERRVESETLRIRLADLQPDVLFTLSGSTHRDCGWLVEDGETVTIDLVRGTESHRVGVANPTFCCAQPVCAFVDHARSVIEEALGVTRGRAE